MQLNELTWGPHKSDTPPSQLLKTVNGCDLLVWKTMASRCEGLYNFALWAHGRRYSIDGLDKVWKNVPDDLTAQCLLHSLLNGDFDEVAGTS
jgi:hypothetical protein